MKIIIIEGDITELITDDGKLLTDGETYCINIRLAHKEDVEKWKEVDAGDIPKVEMDQNTESDD